MSAIFFILITKPLDLIILAYRTLRTRSLSRLKYRPAAIRRNLHVAEASRFFMR